MILTLRFLVDESAGKKVSSALANAKYDAKFVADFMSGAPDSKVLEFAEKEKRILITNDKGFGELIFRSNRPSSGVILLRLNRDSSKSRIEVALSLAENLKENLYSHFIVASEMEFRIRKL